MAAVATDGQGNYVTLDSSGKWVPMAAPAALGQGEHGYAPTTPPEQPASTDIGDITASHPGETDTPGWMSNRSLVDTSIKPGPNVGDIVPLSRNSDTGNLSLALPNPVRALLTEGPQGYLPGPSGQPQPRFETPATTIDPATGTLGVTPEALAAASMFGGPAQTLFSGKNALMRESASPMTLTKPPPVTLPELNAAIVRAGEQPSRNTLMPPDQPPAGSSTATGPGGNAAQPPPEPDLPPVPDGSVRLYHGGADPTSGGARWVTPDYAYARDYREGQPVSYVDVPQDHPAVQGAIASHPDEPVRIASFNAPEDIAKQLRPVAQPQPAGAQGIPAAAPAAASPDPAIMTPAEIQARARGYYSSADQAAASNAMLPDANATAVRKLFSDAVPSDPEQARIAANQPAVQAGKNVDATGPMSFDTAMLLDRDLTDRMRASRGQDVHDLSQLQQGLRDQMDQVPDLDNLRPARQAYTQYIKQSQMDDINYGASLKNDPAAAGAYVRQRAAALLKNDNAMRNWTPEETAALEQVAKSGDIGMLGRLSVSLIKPVIRTVGAAAGHLVGGVPGAFVGAEVGGDIGATQAGKLRAYLSKTTLDPVMEQITRSVPPPNRLGPQPGEPSATVSPPSIDPATLDRVRAQLAASYARQRNWATTP